MSFGSPTHGTRVNWTDCFGTASTAHGSKYVGEFKYGSRHGQGGKLLLLVGAFLAVTVGESLLA